MSPESEWLCDQISHFSLSFVHQALCRALAPNAELASVTSGDLHSRLVSLVTKGGKNHPVLTWLGGTVKASSSHQPTF